MQSVDHKLSKIIMQLHHKMNMRIGWEAVTVIVHSCFHSHRYSEHQSKCCHLCFVEGNTSFTDFPHSCLPTPTLRGGWKSLPLSTPLFNAWTSLLFPMSVLLILKTFKDCFLSLLSCQYHDYVPTATQASEVWLPAISHSNPLLTSSFNCTLT